MRSRRPVRPWATLSRGGQIRRVRAAAQGVLSVSIRIGRPLSHGENTTFELQDGERQVLRVHRPGYHDAATIDGELAWLDALSAAGVAVPVPVPWPTGAQRLSIALPDGPARWAVRFRWSVGRGDWREPTPPVHAERTGRLLATLHAHAAEWTPPTGFRRPDWTAAGLVGPHGTWGDPRTAVPPEWRGMVAEACARITESLEAADLAVGLVHHDLHRRNLLHRPGAVVPIDFDDCGWGYLLTDWRIAQHHHHGDAASALDAAFDRGYRSVRPWVAPDPAVVDVIDRALQLRGLAWLWSRSDVPRLRAHRAKRMGPR
ncbi:MAG: Ser/Thr protein kinase RdoA (MazF antagonist), partial [Myxococcota bacterium]